MPTRDCLGFVLTGIVRIPGVTSGRESNYLQIYSETWIMSKDAVVPELNIERESMTSPTANQTSARLEATFGLGRGWTSQAGQSATVWGRRPGLPSCVV